MRSRYFAIWPALVLLLATTSLAAAQTDSGPTIYLPLIENQGDQDTTEDMPAAYVDGAVSPHVEATIEHVIPFSLREAAGARLTAAAVDIQLAPLDVERLRQEDQDKAQENRAVRIGVVRELPQTVSAADAQNSFGKWHTTSEGGHYWTLTIESPEAKAIRVHLENLAIPEGGHVMVYNTNNPLEVYGPYRQHDLYGNSDLWTASVFGSVATLEYYAPSNVDPAQAATFQVSEITHLYVDLSALLDPKEGSCHNDVTCSAAWAGEATGVAGLGTIGGTAGVLWCTGTLLNDFDGATFEGYFMTANHCLTGNNSDLGSQAQADTIEYYWLFQTATCGGAPPNPADVPRTVGGADLISRQTRNSGNDHAFLRIRNAPPGGLTFVGWDTSAFNNGDDVIGIHHPDGAFKRISFGDNSGSDANYWDVTFTSGVTEPGSSGSAIFDAAHRFRGQLWGGGSSCANPSAEDFYGRFNVTYPNISRWMEIGGTINVNSAYVGVEQGTPAQPFRTAGAAHGFAWDGVRIKFTTGSYPGAVTFNKAVTLVAEGGAANIGN